MRDLREFHDPDLHLPIGGKVYTITSPNADHGLRLRMALSSPEARWTDSEEVQELAKLLGATVRLDETTGDPSFSGGVWDQLTADGVTWEEIVHVGRTALIHYGQGHALAQVFWETALGGGAESGNPTPPAPTEATGGNRATKRAATKKTPAKKKPVGKKPAP